MQHTRRSFFGLIGGVVSAVLVGVGVKKPLVFKSTPHTRSSPFWRVKYPLKYLRMVTREVSVGSYEAWRVTDTLGRDGRIISSKAVCVGRYIDCSRGGSRKGLASLGASIPWDPTPDKPLGFG